ncbi:cutinase family protein [Gordonia sputi]
MAGNRLRTLSQTAAALAAVVATTSTLAMASGSATADAACAPATVIAVPGTWETNPGANPADPVGMLKQVTDQIQRKYGGSVKTLFTPYIADAFRQVAYGTSKASGVEAAKKQLSQVKSSCPETKFAILGFSQGAAAAGDVASDIGNGKGPVPADAVVAVGLLSDPNRGTPGEITIGPQPTGTSGIAGPRPQGMGTLAGKVATICAPAGPQRSADLYCGINARKDGLLATIGSVLSGGSTSSAAIASGTERATPGGADASTSPATNTSSSTSDIGAEPALTQGGGSGDGQSTGSSGAADALATSLTSNLDPNTFGALGQTTQALTKAATGNQNTIDVAQLGQSAASLAKTLSPLVDIATSAASDPGLTRSLSTAPAGSPENAASGVLSAANKVGVSQAVSTANQLAQTASQLNTSSLPSTNPQAQQLTTTAQGLGNQIAPLSSTPADALTSASSVLSVLQPQVIVDQLVNVATGLGGMAANLPKILADLQQLPPKIAALDIDGTHKIAGDLNNLFQPLVKMAAQIDFKAASQIVAMIPDPNGYTQIAAMILSILGNVDVIRLANDVGQAQEVAWASLKNPAAFTGLLPVGLDLASVAVGMLGGTAAKTDPNLLGGSTAVTGQTASMVSAAQTKDLGGLASTLTGLAGSSGAQDLASLVSQGLDAATFYGTGSHVSYPGLKVDQYGRSATDWLADWVSTRLSTVIGAKA